VPFFVASIIYLKLDAALIIFITAVITDAADGFVARRWNMKTRIGAIMDPIADKLLIISAYLSLVCVKGLNLPVDFPPYVPIVVISRDVIILLGAMFIYLVKSELEVRPTILGKMTTFMQMITIIFVLTRSAFSSVVWNVMILFTIVSGTEYVIIGCRQLNGGTKKGAQ
jgi:cardiolipin synthase